ncbi:MAG TPA: outer membrane protein assembly factor BamD [Polyangia bacterium]
MSEERLPPRLELLLAAERAAAPPDGERDEVARRLTKTLGLATLGGGSAAGAAHATGGVKAIVTKSVAAKIVVAVAVGGASVGGVVGTVRLAQRHHHHAIATSAVAAPAVAAPAVVAPAVAAPAPPTAPNSDVHRSRHSDLAAERSLLTDARSALQSGDTARALTILTAHARRFPRGQLAEERDALEIVALARAGDQPRARARAEEFVRRHPHSLFLPSVRQAAPKPGASE